MIAQVQFPTQLGLVERATVSELQKAVREDYPALEEQNIRSFIFNLTLGGEQEGRFNPQTLPEPQWRFSHPESGYVLTLNASAISLETSRYTSRTEFFRRFRACLAEIHRLNPIPFATRLGVRYVDQVPISRCQNLHTMICAPCQGISGLPWEVPVLADTHDFLVQAVRERGVLHGRMGFLPPGATIDPSVLAPLGESCWVLDLDLFRQGEPTMPFLPDDLADDASTFALRIYAVFRWVVNDQFLATFGGVV